MDVIWKLRQKCAEQNIWSAAELKRLLEEKTGLTMTPQGVGKLMRGQPSAITLKTLYALCYVLHCTPNDLIAFDYISLEKFNKGKEKVAINEMIPTKQQDETKKRKSKSANIPLPPI